MWECLNSNLANKADKTSFRRGRTPAITCAANAITEYIVTFDNPMDSTPSVSLTIGSGTTSAQYGSLIPMFSETSVNGFKIRIANNTTIQMSPVIDWIAIGV